MRKLLLTLLLLAATTVNAQTLKFGTDSLRTEHRGYFGWTSANAKTVHTNIFGGWNIVGKDSAFMATTGTANAPTVELGILASNYAYLTSGEFGSGTALPLRIIVGNDGSTVNALDIAVDGDVVFGDSVYVTSDLEIGGSDLWFKEALTSSAGVIKSGASAAGGGLKVHGGANVTIGFNAGNLWLYPGENDADGANDGFTIIGHDGTSAVGRSGSIFPLAFPCPSI